MSVDGVVVEVRRRGDGGVVGVRRAPAPRDSGEDEEMGGVDEAEGEWVWGGAAGRDEEEREWIVKRGHWRLRVEPVDGEAGKMQVVMCPVRIEAISCERTRNRQRSFLG